MKEGKVRLNVLVPKKLALKFKVMCAKNNATISHTITMIMDEYIASKKRVKKGSE